MSREQNRVAWERRLRRFDPSQMTVADFCRREEVSVASYYYWKRQIRPTSIEATTGEPMFVPVNVKPASVAEVRIELPGGATIHIPSDASPDIFHACIVASRVSEVGSEC